MTEKKKRDQSYRSRYERNFPQRELCPTCGFCVPSFAMVEEGKSVPCSEFHVRCVRCQWPVAKDHISPMGTCAFCMSALDRKRYYRRTDGSKMTESRKMATFMKQLDPHHDKNMYQQRNGKPKGQPDTPHRTADDIDGEEALVGDLHATVDIEEMMT